MREFFDARRPAWLVLSLLFVIFSVASCGRVAPSYEPGTIEVTTSEPDGAPISGAAIYIDGDLQEGLTTPHTFTLENGRYEIAVEMDGFFPDPTSTTVDLGPAESASRHFTLANTAPTVLSVTSEPEGAEVYLNGESTPRGVTPLEITLDDDSDVDVALALAGYYVAPASYTVAITAHEVNTVAADVFTLRARKTAMAEGFSNVDCNGCPDLAINMENLMHTAGYGLDHVLYTKFSMFWPGTDPHHDYNADENDARMTYYQNLLGTGIPMVCLDGVKATGTGANNTPTSQEMSALVDDALNNEPGFLIDCQADFTNPVVDFTVTVTAMQDVDLSDLTLYVALVQSYVEYDEAPGSQGETEFHWLFRDRLDTLPTLSNMTAGQTTDYTGTLDRDDWDLDTLHIIAFAQDDATKAIHQAGISALTEHAPAALFLDKNTANRPAPGEERP